MVSEMTLGNMEEHPLQKPRRDLQIIDELF